MKVLLLGSTGTFGKSASKLLVGEDLVTEIGCASRRPDAARRAVELLGSKGHTVCVDISDTHALTHIAQGYDIIINTAGPSSEVQIPAVQAAIAAGVHYCDLGIAGKSAKGALQLDIKAKSRGVTAVISTGWNTMMGLMAVHAAHQLSQTGVVDVCMMADYNLGGYFSPDQSLAGARERGYVETSWDGMEMASEPVWTYREGSWIRLESLENPHKVFHPSGSEVTAYLTDSPLTHTLPGHLPGVQTVSSLFSIVPPALNELFFRESRRIGIGETDWAGAALDFCETAIGDKERYFSMPEEYPTGWWMWTSASGTKDGQKMRYTCWPSMFVDWTSVPLIIIALRILRGDVPLHGVFTTEGCMTLPTFLAEVAKYVDKQHRGEPLLNERMDVLD